MLREILELFYVYYVFYVDVKFEDLIVDLYEFEFKYKEFIEKLLGEVLVLGLCCVFYFLFFVMMWEFCFRFEKIIDDIWNEMDSF